jgi:hypothetical protein
MPSLSPAELINNLSVKGIQVEPKNIYVGDDLIFNLSPMLRQICISYPTDVIIALTLFANSDLYDNPLGSVVVSDIQNGNDFSKGIVYAVVDYESNLFLETNLYFTAFLSVTLFGLRRSFKLPNQIIVLEYLT